MKMNGERALVLLESLINGRTENDSPAEMEELVALGLAASAEALGLRQAEEYRELAARHDIRTQEELRTALQKLEGALKSDFHRMTSYAATLRREEEDRVRLRRLLGVFAMPDEHAAMNAALEAGKAAAVGAQFVPCPGTTRLYAITAQGNRTVLALRPRLERYAKAPFAEFLNRFRKVDDAMEALAVRRSRIAEGLPHVPKGKSQVVVGLLKSGLEAGLAVDAYRKAMERRRSEWLPREAPHLAVACVRKAGASGKTSAASERLSACYQALANLGLGGGPVLRGAAKALLEQEDLEAAARRFHSLYATLERAGVAGDERIRLAARLFPASGEPAEAVRRAADAAAALACLPGSAGRIDSVAATLAMGARDGAELKVRIARYVAIVEELVARGAFSGKAFVPASAVDLVACAGTPAEVVETLRQFVAHLSGEGDGGSGSWGATESWEPGCAFVKRFAY